MSEVQSKQIAKLERIQQLKVSLMQTYITIAIT